MVSTGRNMPSEAEVQAAVRLEYARRGYRLWRNNVGVLPDATGRPIRYGLGNDSPQVNRRLKSSDLIGWAPVIITPALVGETIARFVSFECKPSGWHPSTKYGPEDIALATTPEDVRRELAQQAWMGLVTLDGGEARFMTGVD